MLFLRRCVFHYISFPDKHAMKAIVKVHHPDLDEHLVDAAMAKFYWLREHEGVRKKPSTSELIDWVAALEREGVPLDRLKKNLPFLGVLLKKEADMEHFRH